MIKHWKMVEASVEEGPNVPENAGKMVGPRYRPTHRGLSSAAVTQTGKSWRKCVSIGPMLSLSLAWAQLPRLKLTQGALARVGVALVNPLSAPLYAPSAPLSDS